MSDPDMLDALTRILRDLLADEAIVLTPSTTREDVPGWDSFNYLNFMVAAEIEFGVKFKVAELESFPDVGTIVNSIQRKRGH